MSRLSLWKDGRHTNDYRFLDGRIREQYTIGGTGIAVHKYLGPQVQAPVVTTTTVQSGVGAPLLVNTTANVSIGEFVYGAGITSGTKVLSKNSTSIQLDKVTSANVALGTGLNFSKDATRPAYTNQSEQNIQDLLFLENRDRKYDTSVYVLRGQYQVQDNSFDLSQFGLFLQTGTLFMTFHLNEMVQVVGRKLMNGDVLELPHLTDYNALDQSVPAALKRFYVCSDAQFGSEGFTPTWWPHIWRVKLNPLTDSQEYKDILNNTAAGAATTTPVGDILSTIQKYQSINQAVILQAEADLPKSGYDTSGLYVVSNKTPDQTITTPEDKVHGYLTGDGNVPNGATVAAGVSFPAAPSSGDYYLRLDYVPNRLFRYDGARWVKIEDAVRTNLTPGPDNHTQLSGFINDASTYTDHSGGVHTTLQGLSNALRPKADI